jgi:hypothetical protein
MTGAGDRERRAARGCAGGGWLAVETLSLGLDGVSAPSPRASFVYGVLIAAACSCGHGARVRAYCRGPCTGIALRHRARRSKPARTLGVAPRGKASDHEFANKNRDLSAMLSRLIGLFLGRHGDRLGTANTLVY